jgi:hypothetical protein
VEASAEAAKEDLHSGVSLTKLGNRPIFPFGRRTLLEPPRSTSDAHSLRKTDEPQTLTSEQEQDLQETSSDEAVQRDWDATVNAFLEVLKRSVSKRVSNLPPGRAYATLRNLLSPNCCATTDRLMQAGQSRGRVVLGRPRLNCLGAARRSLCSEGRVREGSTSLSLSLDHLCSN